ncbi:leukocyte immunoglobulin-like receptor subfamily B member 3 isoform X17 [Gallus gallus]|uniref:leukocyte immunoglobulin-like receptor subfamily B member 3 isoform X17 n=1 Tax=Gallus gallus TaxID=9031 RepID=UPI001AE5AB6C|nr:leukocyte immunoglobulin-like receptor subfamily B member 3 isoform X17 [Gallus gallus]
MTRREVALILVSLSPGCSCLMTPMAVALILGWWLVTVSWAQQLPQPFLSLHPSQGVSLGNNVTLRCHLPRVDAWVQLWHNGTLRFKKEKNKEQDAAEFSFAVTNLEDAGTYQCRYQVSKPLRTSKKSDPVELVLTARASTFTSMAAASGNGEMRAQVSALRCPSQCNSRGSPRTARI